MRNMDNNRIIPSITFVTLWGPNKQKTWSGIPWALLNEIKKQTRVKEIPLRIREFSFWDKVKIKLGIFDHDMDLGLVKQNRKWIKSQLTKEDNIVFQFGDFAFDTTSRKTYVYQDACVNYIMNLYKTDLTTFRYSNFSVNGIDAIKKREKYEADYYKNCSGIFTMSHWLKEYLISSCMIPEQRVHHVGGGINVNYQLIDDSRKEGNKILFVGRDFIRKGGGIVCQAFKLLKTRMPNAELHIAGPTSNPLKEDINGTHYWGDCTPDKVGELMNLCDVFCMPSYFEAYGLVFVEALTYGLPCIGRNKYEMPYLIEHGKTGLLINDDNIQLLANNMYELLSNPLYRETVKSKRNEYIRNYSWETVTKKILSVIEKDIIISK